MTPKEAIRGIGKIREIRIPPLLFGRGAEASNAGGLALVYVQ